MLQRINHINRKVKNLAVIVFWAVTAFSLSYTSQEASAQKNKLELHTSLY